MCAGLSSVGGESSTEAPGDCSRTFFPQFQTDDFHVRLTMIFCIINSFLGLLIYCTVGSKITRNASRNRRKSKEPKFTIHFQSLDISTEIYKSDWLNISKKNRMKLVLIMMRTQKPILIKTLVFEATLETFTNVIFLFLNFLMKIFHIKFNFSGHKFSRSLHGVPQVDIELKISPKIWIFCSVLSHMKHLTLIKILKFKF